MCFVRLGQHQHQHQHQHHHRHLDDLSRNVRHFSARQMSEERELHPKPHRSTAWMEKFKERSLYSDRPTKYERPQRLGGIHKRLGKKIDSTDDQADEKHGILMHPPNGTAQHDSNIGGGSGSAGGRNPFRSAAGNAYRSVATVTTPDSMASQSLDEKDPLQMIKVKIERQSPVKPAGHRNGCGNGDVNRPHSRVSSTSAKRTRDDENDSNDESDDVTVVQMPAKRQKIDDTSIDLGLYFAIAWLWI